MTNNFGDYWNQYDDGEAYYYLPLFEHEDYKITNIAELVGEESVIFIGLLYLSNNVNEPSFT